MLTIKKREFDFGDFYYIGLYRRSHFCCKFTISFFIKERKIYISERYKNRATKILGGHFRKEFNNDTYFSYRYDKSQKPYIHAILVGARPKDVIRKYLSDRQKEIKS